MHHQAQPSRQPNARFRRAAVALACTSALSLPASAVEFSTGNPDLSIRWDNTVRVNYAQRVDAQDDALLKSLNFDDGNRNFDKGMVSSRVDLLSEFDLVYKSKFGFRVSGTGWYDPAYDSLDNQNLVSSNHIDASNARALGLSSATEDYHLGPSGELLDAFIFASFGEDIPVNVKLGRHTVYWGESILSTVHGLSYGQAPLDLGKGFSVPGSEVKELFMPRNAVSMQMNATPELSLAAQYFLEWDPARFPESGSYIGFFDFGFEGGESYYLSPTQRVLRGTNVEPEQQGDYGVAMRWSPEWLDGTLGLYYRNTSDIQPALLLTAAAATLPAATCTALGFTAVGATTCYINPAAATVPELMSGVVGRYHTAYADDIEIIGLSLSQSVAGVSIGVDVNYRQNMPLSSDAVRILPASLAAMSPGAITALPAEGEIGAARGDTWHAVLNFFMQFSESPMWDGATSTVEFVYNKLDGVTENAAVYKGRANYLNPATGQAPIDKPTEEFWGVAMNFTPVWYQAFAGVDLLMPMSYSTGLSGTSVMNLGGNEGAGNFAIGIAADIEARYRFDLKYADFFGDVETVNNPASPLNGSVAYNAGANALVSDRGYVSLTFKTTF